MKKIKILIASLITLATLNSYIKAQNINNQREKTELSYNIGNLFICPVSGEKIEINKDTPRLKYNDKTYYFCCTKCLEQFKKETDKYLKGSDENSLIGNKLICPVMKTEFVLKADSPKIEYKGKSYYFCCPDCVEKFKKDPNKYIVKTSKTKNIKHCGKEEDKNKSKKCGKCPEHEKMMTN